MSLYDDLGVRSDADAAEIKRAHRGKAKRCHPDAGGNRDEFERVQHAYMVLTDSARRERYDRTGNDEEEKPDNHLAFIAEQIMAAFDAAVSQNQAYLSSRDIVAATKRVMLEQQQNRKNAAIQIKAQRQMAEELLKRLRFKAKRKAVPDVIGGGLRQRIAGHDEMLVRIAKETADYAEAIKFLDHYGFDFDQPATATGGVLWVRMA